MALYDLIKKLVPALYIISFYLPIKAAAPIAESLAGQETTVSIKITIAVSIVFTLTLAATGYFLRRRIKEQQGQILRLRRRCDELEEELDQAMRQQNP
jgi:ABC-type nitrate/sulfonate/bicarbonate transport system permease component